MNSAASSNDSPPKSKRRWGRKNAYYVVTRRAQAYPAEWFWEIRRYTNPMGVRLQGGGYKTERAARVAGQQYLARFLDELSDDTKSVGC